MARNDAGAVRCVWFSLAVLVLALLPGGLFAQVVRDELEGNLGPVDFINYEGPHARIETRAQIRNIGYTLGTAVRGGALRPGDTNRYFVIHTVSGPEGNKLDADIFGLGPGVGVDHIRNLRLIIQGYLEGAYGYNDRDAALLAEFITVYNAVYRGDWNYLSARYKAQVSGYLTREKAGLSTRYDEWPGQTLIVIPLGPGTPGSLSAIDTSALIEKKVTDELRRDDGLGVDQRKGMVDLLERESAEAEQRAQEEKAAAAREQERIAAERQAAAAERERIAAEQRRVQADADAGRISGEEARRAGEELSAQQASADKKDEELDAREKALAEQGAAARESEEFADQKAGEAQDLRKGIAGDQQALIVREENSSRIEGEVLLVVMNGPGSPLGSLIRFDPGSGTELKRSVLNTVNPRTITRLGDRLLVIAGENRGSGAIRLVELSPDTLELLQQGNDDLSPESLIWVNGMDIYAVVSSGGLYLVRLNGTSLAREARSPAQVHPYATLLFQGGIIITQRADGSALRLDAKALTEK